MQPVADIAAAALDEAPAWTLDQAVGLVFGGLLLLLYLSSTQVQSGGMHACCACTPAAHALGLHATPAPIICLTAHPPAPQVDQFVARDQRRQLGLCERCGGMNEPGSCAEANCPMRRR